MTSAPHSTPTILLGTANFGPVPPYTHHTADSQRALVEAFKAQGYTRIDTARLYGFTPAEGSGGSERALATIGVTGADSGLVVDTKIDFVDGAMHSDDKIRSLLAASLKDLGVDKVNTLYLHGPDRITPLEHVMCEMNALYEEGRYSQFGISNYTPDEVERMLKICNDKGYVRPTVYQGNYSALARRSDKVLIPLLREEGIAFYAYSPLAMGLLSGKGKDSPETAANYRGGRFHAESRKASVFQGQWFKPKIFAAVARLNELTAAPGSPSALSLSLRWLAFHSGLDASKGDGIILGASSVAQLDETLAVLKDGPLGEDDLRGMREVVDIVGEDAPMGWM